MLGVGSWALGVGRWVARQGHPRGSRFFKKGVGSLPGRRFRAAPAGPPPLDVAADPPRRRRPQNRADEMAEPPPTPKTPLGRQRGLDSAYIVTLTSITAERKKFF